MRQIHAFANGSRRQMGISMIFIGPSYTQKPRNIQLRGSSRNRSRAVQPRATPKTKGGDAKLPQYRPPSKEEAALRAEVEAPFRSLRLVLFGFGTVSATLATLFSFPYIIATLSGAPNAKSLTEVFQDFGINVGALAACAALLRNDLQAREKQMDRLLREDKLGACQLELANGRVLRLAQLRGAARPVIVAGTPAQVATALEDAEPYKEVLADRGVLVICVPISNDPGGEGSGEQPLPALTSEDLRWRAVPIRLDEWRRWFNEQASAAGKSMENGLYLSLRLDGRVRGSGQGRPPWAKLAAALPPTEGFFGGLLDGMDGRV
jgi:hypothetical protein